ncbi:hypothetical protein CASFOL_020991 [Castilleja foliolosa]|uniref:Uncharacterized protein n=1 Tax=Castilleja foliolosa TaxID=1961234 RepID=A0ABD3D5G9_9LAMI
MPQSPANRISIGRDLRSEDHKRRDSFESAISRREKDDELALFNEVQSKERDNFLLQSNDDFDDDIFSTKLRYFSDHKVEISVPARGESSDLLKADGDKNNYDWLITPPETPLFRSMDDEAPPQVKPPHRTRPMSQPVPISRSPTTEKGQRNGRACPSPNRLGPSRSSSNSSPPPVTRHISSPSRGFSPPASKPSPGPRFNTPPLRRITSSAPPKIKAWQTNGFASEAPSNLRGSSPTSRNRSRNSRSPVASRSVCSSHSKGSVSSFGDDDLDSLRSLPVRISGRSGPQGVNIYPSKSPVNFSRKPTRSLSNSATKRSLDLDRKGPQNMFRPLLSSVPISTSHAENASSQHYSLAFKHSSSITTSNDPSSDLATSGPHDNEEGSEENQDNMKGHSYPYADDELFLMDQACKLIEVIDEIDVKNDGSNAVNSPQDMVTCSKCGQLFHLDVVIEGDPQYCRECKNSELNSNISNPVVILTSNTEKVDSQHSSCESIKNLQIIPSVEKGFNYPKCVNDARRHIFENTSFTTSNTSFSLNSTKSSISMSVSSSADLGFSRQAEGRVYPQSSGQKSDTENYGYEFEEKMCLDPCEQLLASTCTEIESAVTNIENNVVLKRPIQEEDAGPDSLCADGVDIAEVPYTGSMDAISEIEIESVDVVICADSSSHVDSIDLKRCTDELRDDEDITEIVDELDVSQPNHRVIDESRIWLDESNSKSRTLEEATDAILFCSSIVHNITYEAANIAIYKETSPIEVIRPTVTYLEKPDSERRDNNTHSKTMQKRNSKSRKDRPKRPEMNSKPPSCNEEIDGKSNFEAPNNTDSIKPPKVESKCNCIIM